MALPQQLSLPKPALTLKFARPHRSWAGALGRANLRYPASYTISGLPFILWQLPPPFSLSSLSISMG